MRSPDSKKPKLLVVDDEPDNLDLLYRTFRREYHVLRAESGPKALEILEQEGNVAVIISDQRMPMMSGTEFLSLTATKYPDTIRIILTGYTDVEDLVEAINAGRVFKYVTKPWDDQELKAVVKQAVDTHNVLRARTQELARTLRQESLLNALTNTIRSALDYRQILQTIVEAVGQSFDVDYCLLRPCQDNQLQAETFVYQRGQGQSAATTFATLEAAFLDPLPVPPNHAQLTIAEFPLQKTVWATREVQRIHNLEELEVVCQTALPLAGGDPVAYQQELRQIYEAMDIHASLLVPLICRQELMAVLGLHQCGQPRFWDEADVTLISTVADQAALALAQAQSYERVRALAQRESLVNTITTAIRSSLDPEQIFAAITQQLGEALQVDSCALSLWSEGDQFVRCVGLYTRESGSGGPGSGAKGGETPAPVHRISPLATGELGEVGIGYPQAEDERLMAINHRQLEERLSGKSGSSPVSSALPQSSVPIESNPALQQLLLHQEPVVIDDVQQHPEFQLPDMVPHPQTRSLLIVPLITDGKIIGSISLRQVETPRRWQPNEVELALAVATQAAIAVQQSRLYQRVAELNTYLTESVLRRFLPASLVKKAAVGELSLDLSPEPRLVTILFSDIVGFTRLAGRLKSRRVAALLNEYLEAMVEAIFANRGTVDKFLGDGILALFGAPEELPADEQVRCAIATARQMQVKLIALNERWVSQGIGSIQFRCGIHQGSVVVGMFGSAVRSDYTAIGPAVNIAARLQEAATPGTILVSARVAGYLDSSDLLQGHALHLKGVEQPFQAFTVRSYSQVSAQESSVRS
ncbi:GAF domain-containing protein [Trichothermofontia sichuanensis B231]|uniref:GAF domain-containing protein n=1 Tax=Trichothermofontia sichuanensis TaxID=3045816 RepID=UPI002247D515|nr:GAF domain-containing protein [Trichothermofontia sichuanensis]UZQ54368.1 GAF domain-containing protein [Trichothermofontia sichuanensis B231]